jgi:penicillin-binding protein-related factor A (putative recombinase)
MSFAKKYHEKHKKLKDWRGRLTDYGLACGYVDKFEMKDEDRNISVKLFSEHGVYHLEAYDHEKMERLLWVCPVSLDLAYRKFNSMKRLTQARNPVVEKLVAKAIEIQAQLG